ncbi:inositol monophosphatase family protein [Microbacterium sp. HD4P20]|uniref:inositol monophosphatase family protein n=1 Tax=Microbacterium sp. HD4P20 TaxID=2864874 RepID=UPI0020A3115E|nr:inositol monophosphatase family protein [Microbacterium sp. HD4P20]MCP2635546.1 inositol monophosphatase family protein [Microbacterium sp. HD4P20]
MVDLGVSDVEVAVRAALAGAAVVRSRFGAETRRIAKQGLDFATDVDIEAERAIRDVLAESRPDDGVVGEELGAVGLSSRRWLVDPLCGTLNFAAGVPLFGVNVALEEDGLATTAAVADPAAGDVFWTDGAGAWRRSVDKPADRPLVPSPSSRLVSIDLDASYPADIGIRLLSHEPFRAEFGPRCLSTTLALAWVATGQQAGYITGGDLRGSVHWTAGIALCRAAGVRVTNLAGDELHTGEHGLIAAADAETHASLLSAMNSLR